MLGSLIDDPIALQPGRSFGAIVGLSPSKGARSPILWRAAFRALGYDVDFHPLDVGKDKLASVMDALKRLPDFVGGAVAVPYKEAMIGCLDEVEPEAAAIGAVNAIYRRADGALVGANTDGAAALQSLSSGLGPVAGRKVVQLGIGGAGRAVAVYLAGAGAQLAIWNRTEAQTERFMAERRRPNTTACRHLDTALADADFLVNCTSAGFAADGADNIDVPFALEMLSTLKPSAGVFDIVYQPQRTALLAAAERGGHKTLNGLEMNCLQAVIAFTKAFTQADRAAVTAAMKAA